MRVVFFFFNDTATTEIYTLSLHDALPISVEEGVELPDFPAGPMIGAILGAECASAFEDLYESGKINQLRDKASHADRKSTRLNSSHANISYAVFCLKKKKYKIRQI